MSKPCKPNNTKGEKWAKMLRLWVHIREVYKQIRIEVNEFTQETHIGTPGASPTKKRMKG